MTDWAELNDSSLVSICLQELHVDLVGLCHISLLWQCGVLDEGLPALCGVGHLELTNLRNTRGGGGDQSM